MGNGVLEADMPPSDTRDPGTAEADEPPTVAREPGTAVEGVIGAEPGA